MPNLQIHEFPLTANTITPDGSITIDDLKFLKILSASGTITMKVTGMQEIGPFVQGMEIEFDPMISGKTVIEFTSTLTEKIVVAFSKGDRVHSVNTFSPTGTFGTFGQWLFGSIINLGVTFPFLGGFMNKAGSTQGVFQSADMVCLDVMQPNSDLLQDTLPLSLVPVSAQVPLNSHKKLVFQVHGLQPGDTINIKSAVSYATLNVFFTDTTVINRMTGVSTGGNITQDGIYEADVEGLDSIFYFANSLAAATQIIAYATRS